MSDEDCAGVTIQLCELLCICCIATDGCKPCCDEPTPTNTTSTTTNNAATRIPYTNVYNVQTAQPTRSYVPRAPQVPNYPTNAMLRPQPQPTAPSEEENLLSPLRFGGVVNDAPPSYEEATKNSASTELIPKKVDSHHKEY